MALLLTPTVTSAVALAAVQAMTAPCPSRRRIRGSRTAACSVESYAHLAALPPGLVATDIDYGPFVLALTPHSVMSAPYHRLVGPIIAAHQIFALPPAAAREVVARTKPDYLAVCDRHTLGGIGEAERAASLWGRLAAGEVPDWLEPVAETRDRPFVVYRVKLSDAPGAPVAAMVSGLLVLTISTIPALRLRGGLLYDAVNPAGPAGKE